MKSKTGDHWTTPQFVVDSIFLFNGGRPALDPCSNPKSLVHAKVEWFGPPKGTDGLVAPWIANGLIYANPPYSQKPAWTNRCWRYGKAGQEIIALIPADTDTAWFHRYCWTAQQRCFLAGRLIYGGDKEFPARFPSVLVYWGRRVKRFREVFSAFGHCC